MAESASLTNAQSGLCTKLSQLQKVVEYLNFHIEEHYFQIDEIQKRFEKEEDIIVNETQSEIESIYSSLNVEQTDIIKKIDNDFKAQTNDLKSEMKQFQTKIMDETKNSIKDISSDIDHYHGKIKRITKEMKREIAFLQDNSKVDPMNVQKKLRDLVDSHKMTLDAHDKESQRKQKLFEEQALSSQDEITKKYSKTINELKRKLRPPPQIRNQIIQSLRAIKKELFNMRNESNKVRSEAKKLATITFSSKLPEIYEVTNEMKKENEQFIENYEKLKTLLQDTIFQIKGEKNIYLEKLRNFRVNLANEINALNEELICASDPVYLEKKKLKMEEEEIENHIKNLQKQIDEIKDLNSLHEKEKNDLKMEFEDDIKFENDLFEERKKIVIDQIETQKVYQEKQKEKENLLQYKKSLTLNQPSITIGQISVKTEIGEIETLFNKEYSKAKIDQKDSISKYFLECDAELNRRKEETKDEYEKKMASITNEYKDNDVVKKVSQQYEELLLSLQSQLIKSENNDKNEEETEEELKKLQAKFLAKINQERSDLIQNFEKLMQEEDQRFHNSPAFLDDTDYTDLLLEEKNKKKDFLSKYDDEIKLLEEEKDKIEESITLDENLKKVKEDSQFQIKCALQQKTDASKSLIAQISACSEKYSNLIHEESTTTTSSSSLPFQISYDKLNQEIQLNRENNERQINIEKKIFERKSKSIKSTYSKTSKKVKNEISILKNSMQENEKQFDIEKQHRQSDFEMKIIQVEKDIVSQKPISTPTQLFIEYDNKINLLQRERDRKMRLYNNSVSKNGVKLMRDQERDEIDRLEIELYDKTKQLAELGKDLVIAREISLKEKENNGVDIKLNKEDNLAWQRRNVSTSLSITTKPNGRKQINSSVEIKRPNMSRTTGQILNFK